MTEDVVELIDTKAAAERWQVSDIYIRKLLREGKIRGRKIRREWLVDTASLDKFMQGRRWIKGR